MSFTLEDSKYNPKIKQFLKDASLKVLLKKNIQDIQQMTRLNADEAKGLLVLASEAILQKTLIPVLQVPKPTTVTTGCKAIDDILNGGISQNGITEIYGASSVGKTQICLQLCLTVQLMSDVGAPKGAVYICTEDTFPSRRLHHLAKVFPLYNERFRREIAFEDNIFIDHVADFEQLRRCLYIKLPHLLSSKKVGLIIIDSIAGIFRSENENVNYFKRSTEFLTITSKLNEISEKHQIAVVCVNQVSDVVQTGETDACLGLAWKNLITHRFYISRFYDNMRKIEIIFSPYLKNSSCNFMITDVGIVD